MKNFAKNEMGTKRFIAKSVETMMNTISLIYSGGKKVNVKNNADSDLREVKIVAPYGISSSGKNGMRVAVLNDGNIPYMIGVYDMNKPSILPGETIIYSDFGQMIKLLTNGSIVMKSENGDVIIENDGNLTINGNSLNDIIDERINSYHS